MGFSGVFMGLRRDFIVFFVIKHKLSPLYRINIAFCVIKLQNETVEQKWFQTAAVPKGATRNATKRGYRS